MTQQIDEYEKYRIEEQHYKAKLFTYPDWQSPSGIFDEEDLDNHEMFMVLCARSKPDEIERQDNLVFVWHGSEHDISQEEQ